MSQVPKKFTAVKGMSDIMPPESHLWQGVEAAARKVFAAYGYHEIRTPVLESTELFERGVGEATQVVEKEMYSFTDQGGDSVSLRPEGTASVIRAYIESGAHVAEPIARYYYIGPMFRRERPQKGRYRQFHQIGYELIGVESPLADAEVIAMASHFLDEVGVGGIEIEINSIGCGNCRPSFNTALMDFLKGRKSALCDDCARRLDRNPLRMFDCKQKACQEILNNSPRISSYWCDPCKAHFGTVRHALDIIKIPYKLNERIVRGLDYYMRTAFEFVSQELGAQNAVAAGGRYDGLAKALGGPDVSGVGIAIGLERLILILRGAEGKPSTEDIVFFVVIGERAQEAVLPIIQTLRRDGVCVEWDYAARSLKSQMRRANKIGAETVVIVGDNEIAKGHVVVRDMRAGTQREVRIQDLPMHFVQIGG